MADKQLAVCLLIIVSLCIAAHLASVCRFKNSAMGKGGIQALMLRLCARAGTADYYSGHSLRASFVTWCKQAGLPDEEIAAISGHRSLEALNM